MRDKYKLKKCGKLVDTRVEISRSIQLVDNENREVLVILSLPAYSGFITGALCYERHAEFDKFVL